MTKPVLDSLYFYIWVCIYVHVYRRPRGPGHNETRIFLLGHGIFRRKLGKIKFSKSIVDLCFFQLLLLDVHFTVSYCNYIYLVIHSFLLRAKRSMPLLLLDNYSFKHRFCHRT
ncbi:hypothetical protein F5Y10DRAFT_247704 [Nemania abortiva]|nr:hypothetical protein F5Y10DRAFT_247704 [Nemania abortiva]